MGVVSGWKESFFLSWYPHPNYHSLTSSSLWPSNDTPNHSTHFVF